VLFFDNRSFLLKERQKQQSLLYKYIILTYRNKGKNLVEKTSPHPAVTGFHLSKGEGDRFVEMGL